MLVFHCSVVSQPSSWGGEEPAYNSGTAAGGQSRWGKVPTRVENEHKSSFMTSRGHIFPLSTEDRVLDHDVQSCVMSFAPG